MQGVADLVRALDDLPAEPPGTGRLLGSLVTDYLPWGEQANPQIQLSPPPENRQGYQDERGRLRVGERDRQRAHQPGVPRRRGPHEAQ